MPLNMGRVLAMEDEPSTSTATEYRQSYLSPRREAYNPQITLPKVSSARPPSNRAFLSFDVDPDAAFKSSEYRLCFENYHPKRPYCFHAKPSHVFDYVLKPIERRATSRLSANKDTEYQDRYLNYRSFMPIQELLPPHRTVGQSSTQSDTQQKKEHMTRSHYFHQLVQDNEKLSGGQRIVGTSEHRNAFQWPYPYPQVQPRPPLLQQPQQQYIEVPPPVYPPYLPPKNIYEPLPPLQRTIIKATY